MFFSASPRLRVEKLMASFRHFARRPRHNRILGAPMKPVAPVTRAGLGLLAGALLSWSGVTNISKVWVADNGDGTYKNPILHADYSDLDVVRVGGDFFSYSTDGTNFTPAGESFTARAGRWRFDPVRPPKTVTPISTGSASSRLDT